jgi:hypothetical protein
MDKQIDSASSPSFLRKVIQFPFTRIFIALLFVVGSVILTTVLLSLIRNQFFPDELIWSSVKYAIPIILIAYFSYRWYVRLVERRSVKELSKKGALKELGAGVLLGTIVVAVIPIGILWLLPCNGS